MFNDHKFVTLSFEWTLKIAHNPSVSFNSLGFLTLVSKLLCEVAHSEIRILNIKL